MFQLKPRITLHRIRRGMASTLQRAFAMVHQLPLQAQRIRFRLHMPLSSATQAVTRATEKSSANSWAECDLICEMAVALAVEAGGMASANGWTVMHAGFRLCMSGQRSGSGVHGGEEFAFA